MNFKNLFMHFPGAVTVCNRDGRILAMNDRARETFAGDGGEKLLGTNVLDCHPEPARSKLKAMLVEGRTNVYTIEKKGVQKLIYQSPWKENGAIAGFLEISLVIPETMPHFVRGN
ncbi:MAG: PAS domain-containing protein [Candidatus Aminicenantales bacterium]